MEGINGRRNEQQSDRAENHDQNGSYLGRFEVEKVKFLMSNASCIYLDLCFLSRQGAHFQKIRKKRWSDSARWSRKTINGKCDGYMGGLGGAKKRKSLKSIGF